MKKSPLWIFIAILAMQAPSSLAAETKAGENLFKTNCAQCHNLPNLDQYTSPQISMIIDIMQEVMTARKMTRLTEEEKKELLAYLTDHKNAPTEPDTEHDLYIVRCSLCHQTPEPDMLNIKQWKVILRTMDRRMKHSDIPELTETERSHIINYLTKHAEQ